MTIRIPGPLAHSCQRTPAAAAWLEDLPDVVRDLQNRWSLTVGHPFTGQGASGGWVVPATLRDGTPAVLKIGMPHLEGEHEIAGLRFWDGDPTVRLLEADPAVNALLLERCTPGSTLRALPEPDQDMVIADLLRRLWRTPRSPHPFRPLSVMLAHWRDEALGVADQWQDPALVNAGLDVFRELGDDRTDNAPLLATDLHAGNVLRAEREPWLVIDPKPFVGDPAYDATQHLLNCPARLLAHPDATIRSFADRLELDQERLRSWTFARAAVPLDAESSARWLPLARALAP